MKPQADPPFLARLRRDLGTVEAYAALIGILVGAGIFRVTGVASELTGSGVIVGYLVLAPVVFATSLPYVAFLSTSLGREPGGDYLHIARTFGSGSVAFLCGWLKLISYLGAAAFLARVLADYLIELDAPAFGWLEPEIAAIPLAVGALFFFVAVHALGVRWFGRFQVGMCALVGVAILILVIPGLFAVDPANLRPLFPQGAGGFLAALPPLFFAFAAFESLAHTAGEVRDSTRRLPSVFLRGIAASTAIFVALSWVAFGVMPAAELAASDAPMAAAAAVYLPAGSASIVTLGGVLAVATSLNATLMVPGRLALTLERDGFLPAWFGGVHAVRGTPTPGLVATLAVALILLLTGQFVLALNIAVLALQFVYAIHALALICLPRSNPQLWDEVTRAAARGRLSARWLSCGAWMALAAMTSLILVQLLQDVRHIADTSFVERYRSQSLTNLELLFCWGVLGLVLAQRRRPRARTRSIA